MFHVMRPPDTRSAQFRQKCELESRSLAADPQEAETLAGIAEVADTDGWEWSATEQDSQDVRR